MFYVHPGYAGQVHYEGVCGWSCHEGLESRHYTLSLGEKVAALAIGLFVGLMTSPIDGGLFGFCIAAFVASQLFREMAIARGGGVSYIPIIRLPSSSRHGHSDSPPYSSSHSYSYSPPSPRRAHYSGSHRTYSPPHSSYTQELPSLSSLGVGQNRHGLPGDASSSSRGHRGPSSRSSHSSWADHPRHDAGRGHSSFPGQFLPGEGSVVDGREPTLDESLGLGGGKKQLEPGGRRGNR